MDIKPIKTRADYRAALKEIEKLTGAKANSPEGEKLDVLATLAEAYERKHYALDLPALTQPRPEADVDPTSTRRLPEPSPSTYSCDGSAGADSDAVVQAATLVSG